ncbi:MAG: hypothetical protein WCG75_00180 [Armatimonadota bacterium]
MTFKIGFDINGNKVCRVSCGGERGFSIQTNGNLPNTHRDGVCKLTEYEVETYILSYGTRRQKTILAAVKWGRLAVGAIAKAKGNK